MKNNQKFSPKYWVAHHQSTDDVLIESARKSKADVYKWLNSQSYKEDEDWYNLGFRVVLIELFQIELN